MTSARGDGKHCRTAESRTSSLFGKSRLLRGSHRQSQLVSFKITLTAGGGDGMNSLSVPAVEPLHKSIK